MVNNKLWSVLARVNSRIWGSQNWGCTVIKLTCQTIKSSYHHELILLLAPLDAFEQGTAPVQTTKVSSIICYKLQTTCLSYWMWLHDGANLISACESKVVQKPLHILISGPHKVLQKTNVCTRRYSRRDDTASIPGTDDMERSCWLTARQRHPQTFLFSLPKRTSPRGQWYLMYGVIVTITRYVHAH